MSPVQEDPQDDPQGLYAFSVSSDRPIPAAGRTALLQAVRRALMGLARARFGQCPLLFSGHESDGAPARSGQHRHLYLALTGDEVPTLWVAAPWRVDRTWEPLVSDRRAFREVLEELSTVRAGRLGLLRLRPRRDGAERLLGPARTWISAPPYRANRYARPGQDVGSAVAADIAQACVRLGRPRPRVELLPSGSDRTISARLGFARAVVGPLMIGRDAHCGGGLFLPKTPTP